MKVIGLVPSVHTIPACVGNPPSAAALKVNVMPSAPFPLKKLSPLRPLPSMTPSHIFLRTPSFSLRPRCPSSLVVGGPSVIFFLPVPLGDLSSRLNLEE